MSRIFNGEWWSLRLPSGWRSRLEKHGASFSRAPRVGTLQVSAAVKNGGEVSDNDLLEYAAERLSAGHQLKRTRHQAFSGFKCIRTDGAVCWREWWLKHGALMIYATYVVSSDRVSEAEMAEVISILDSLAAR